MRSFYIVNSDWRFFNSFDSDGVPHFTKDFHKARAFKSLNEAKKFAESIKGDLKFISCESTEPPEDKDEKLMDDLNNYMIQYFYANSRDHRDRPLACVVGNYESKSIGIVQIKQTGNYNKAEVRAHAIRRALMLKPIFACEIQNVVEGQDLRNAYILPDWLLQCYNKFKSNFLEEIAERKAYNNKKS